VLSRNQALKKSRGREIDRELAARGIHVMSRGRKTLGEEMSEAYKDVADVVSVMAAEGITRIVAKLVPMGVVKG
jgi:tRNA-splicing ligase RtcB